MQGDSAMETTKFVESTDGEILTYPQIDARIADSDLQPSAKLGDFLSRPTLIYTIDWTIGGAVDQSFDPWTLFLNHTAIKYKLNNFAFLRGNLNLKVIVSASPFYYGDLLCVYTPLPTYANSPTGFAGERQIPLSQRPNVHVYPQTNSGGTMSLPFVWHSNYVNLTLASEVAELGQIDTLEFAALDSANGASSSTVTIHFYAWMDDPVLMGPTVGLAMQGDEYGDGPVSAPASAVALWSDYFTKIPIIGRFAKATGIGARAVSGIAGLFGWTNVPVIEDVKPVKNLPFHDLTSGSLSEPTNKIFLDPKGELSVDPAIVGLPSDDELSIPYLVQKESYLGSSTWAVSGSVGALVLCSQVTPCNFHTFTGGTTVEIMSTPTNYLAYMFNHWRGDLIYRFKIICTQYHRGRLRFTWDPVSSLTATTDYSHLAFTEVIDIGETQDFEIRVPYTQAASWSNLYKGRVPRWSNGTYIVNQLGFSNGTWTMRVLTSLTAPVDVAPVTVQVYVRGAPNLEFANPVDMPTKYSHFEMQGDVSKSDEPMDETPAQVGRYLIHWGEAIPSMRNLLRRSTRYDVIDPNNRASTTDIKGVSIIIQSRVPGSPGYDTTAYTGAKDILGANTQKYSYVYMTPVRMMMSMFLMHRGSLRWHYNYRNQQLVLPSFTIQRRYAAVGANTDYLEGHYGTIVPAGGATASTIKRNSTGWVDINNAGNTGMVLNNLNTQTGMSVEFPMMTNSKFYVTTPSVALVGTNFDGSDVDCYNIVTTLYSATESAKYSSLERYVSIGTDFNLHFFMNAPNLFYDDNSGTVPV